MALTYDQINSITQKKFIPKLYDNIFDSNVLLMRMRKGEMYKKIDGGERIIVPLEYAQLSAAGTYSGSDILDTTDNQTFTAAEYVWKQYFANISITGIDKVKNSGDSQVIDFVKSKVSNAERTLAQILGDGVYSSGTDSKSLVGLRVAGANNQTVGGIDQSAFSFWRMQLDSTTTVLTIPALQTIFNQSSIGQDMPTIALTSRTLYNSYYNTLQPQQRFTDTTKGMGGFQNLMFNNVPVVVDAKSPANNFWFLNEKYLALYVHKDMDMKFLPFIRPVNQDVESAKVLWAGALGYSNLRMLGRLSALTS